MNKIDDAVVVLKKAYEIDPNSADIFRFLKQLAPKEAAELQKQQQQQQNTPLAPMGNPTGNSLELSEEVVLFGQQIIQEIKNEFDKISGKTDRKNILFAPKAYLLPKDKEQVRGTNSSASIDTLTQYFDQFSVKVL